MPRRFQYPAILAAVVFPLVPAVQADGPTRKQIACMLALNAAGAHVAAVSAAAATRCVRAACAGKLPRGETADQCLAADRGGAVGRAERRTVAVAGRKCREAPPFGPQSAQEVNDAFAAPLRLHAVFGPELAAVLKTTATDRAAAGCQIAAAKGLALVTLAELGEFNRCKRFKLRHGATSILVATRPEPQAVFATIATERPTVFYSVPTSYAALLAAAEEGAECDLSGLANDQQAVIKASPNDPSVGPFFPRMVIRVYTDTSVQEVAYFSNDPRMVHFSYVRYLDNTLREHFGFDGTPIRIEFRGRNDADASR